jgi:hypothetical protein
MKEVWRERGVQFVFILMLEITGMIYNFNGNLYKPWIFVPGVVFPSTKLVLFFASSSAPGEECTFVKSAVTSPLEYWNTSEEPN